jgi:hypothetical protein
MTDGRMAAKRLVATTGASQTLMALLQSGPSYIKSLSYDTRIVDKTVKAATIVLLEMRLIKVAPTPPNANPFAKEYYELTSTGKEIAIQLQKCEQDMIRILDKILRQHHSP